MKDGERKSKTPVWHLVLVGAVSFAIVASFYLAGAKHFGSDEWDKFGTYIGGAAGVLLTSLTFLALLYTIYIQSSELRLSREELRLTREEMKLNRDEVARSAEALNQQVTAIEIQNFERSLFDSLRFLNDVVAQFEHRSPLEDQPRRGASAFVAMYQHIGHSSQLGALGAHNGDAIGEHLPLNQVLDVLRPMLGTYFRTLYNIYRYLDESNYADRVYYNRIIRSQIPDHALVILFYNSLTDRGLKFQKYIVRYRILDNMLPGYLFNPHHAEVLENMPTPKAEAILNPV